LVYDQARPGPQPPTPLRQPAPAPATDPGQAAEPSTARKHAVKALAHENG